MFITPLSRFLKKHFLKTFFSRIKVKRPKAGNACCICECTHVYNLQFYYSESNKIELMHLHIISLRPLKLNQGMCYILYKSKCKLNDYLFHFTFASHTAKHYQTELQLILRFDTLIPIYM